MTTTQPNETENHPLPFGTRLQHAREALGLERKDVASQLRLSEKLILMMEKERYPTDLPTTFARGYLKSYSKFLQIPDHEIKKAIERIKPKPVLNSKTPTLKSYPIEPAHTNSSLTQVFSVFIVLIMGGLVGIWYYTHNLNPNHNSSEIALNSEDSIQSNLMAIEPAQHSAALSEKQATHSGKVVLSDNMLNNQLEIGNTFTSAHNTAAKAKTILPNDSFSFRQLNIHPIQGLIIKHTA